MKTEKKDSDNYKLPAKKWHQPWSYTFFSNIYILRKVVKLEIIFNIKYFKLK